MAERRLLESAEEQLGKQRYLVWIRPVDFCRSELAFAPGHEGACS
ncbi:MAG: hypothetical protein AAAC50_08540 [Rhizobium altiplani]